MFIDRILIFLASAVLLVSVVRSLASSTCESPSVSRLLASAPRYPGRLMLSALRYASLMSPVGAYDQESSGVIECRKRVTEPIPGNNAKRVGVALSEKTGRFD